MPCIEVKTSAQATQAQKELLKARLGEYIRTIPGKSENWLMVVIQDGMDVYFQGDGETPAAFLEVKVFDRSPRDPSSAAVFDTMTAKVTAAVHEILGVDPARIYVKYERVPDWGYNGSNF